MISHNIEEYSWTSVIISGAVAGVVSRFVVAPLDLLKIRLQLRPSAHNLPINYLASSSLSSSFQQKTQQVLKNSSVDHKDNPKLGHARFEITALQTLREIFKNGGVKAFWKGNLPAQLLYLSYGSIQFVTYAQFLSTFTALHSSLFPSQITTISTGVSSATPTLPEKSIRSSQTFLQSQNHSEQLSRPPNLSSSVNEHEARTTVNQPIPNTATLTPASSPIVAPAISFLSGAGAGLVSTFVTYPFDVLRTRFAAQGPVLVYRSFFGAIETIYRNEGVSGYFRGLSTALLQIGPYMGFFFSIYTSTQPMIAKMYTRYMETRRGNEASSSIAVLDDSPPDVQMLSSAAWLCSEPSSGSKSNRTTKATSMNKIASTTPPHSTRLPDHAQSFANAVAGMLAAVLSKTIVYPLDTTRKRLQVQGPDLGRYVYPNVSVYDVGHHQNYNRGNNHHQHQQNSFRPRGPLATVAAIARAEGILSLYRGYLIALLKAAPASAVTIWTYETMIGLIGRRSSS